MQPLEKLSLPSIKDQLIVQIFSFLDVTTVYTTATLISKRFFVLIFSQKYIPYECIQQLIGQQLSVEFYKKLDHSQILSLLKQLYSPHSLDVELPFYGFKGDCGADVNAVKYLFNYLFKVRRLDSVCTKIGQNFHIHGALAYDYYDRQLDKDEKMPLTDFEKADCQSYLAEKDENRAEIMQNLPLNAKNLEFKYKLIDKLALIKRFRISRQGVYSCPIRTAMIFTSMSEIDEQCKMLQIFSKANTTSDIRSAYLKNYGKLPSIYSTNVEMLRPWTSYFMNQNDGIEIVIFENGQRQNKVKPMIWIRFTDVKKQICDLEMQWGNFFSGRFILLKMIDCDNKIEELGDEYDDEPNIDINYVSLKGVMLEFY